MKFRNKKLLLALGIIALTGLIVPHFAHAGFMDSALSDVVTWTVKFIAYIFNFIGSLLFGFAGSLVEFTLKLNLSVTDMAKNSLVNVGWKITRDIANLGFVLAMIILAFATIVGNEEYGYKKLLPKLIAAAILINFSLAIGGVFIDFSHVITNFFMGKVSDTGYFGITEKLANAFGTQRFLLGDSDNPLPPNPADEAGVGTRLSTAVIVSIAEMVFIIAFTLVAAIVLFTLAILLLVRFVKLSFLLILAPITWLFWVIPGQGKQFSNWWSSFIEQVFFAPAMMFFVYLALASVSALGDAHESAAFFKAGALQAILTSGSQMILLVGILVGGLIAAQKMGIEGAKVGMDRVTAFGKIAKNYASNTAKDLGKSVAKSKPGQAISRQALRFGGGVKKLGEYKPTTKTGKVVAAVSAPWRAPVQAAFSLAGQGLQTTVGGAPSKPDSLGSLAWAAVTGGEKGVTGQYDKAKKAKEEKDLPDLQKSHQEKLARREELKANGADTSIINKEIVGLESEMKKKTELPEDEDGLVKTIEDFEKKRQEMVSKSLDSSFYVEQIKKAKASLDKVRKTNFERSPVRRTWEDQISKLNAQKDSDLRSGIHAPGTPHALDGAIKTAEAQVKLWQKIDAQKKPSTKAQWTARATDLQAALTEAKKSNFDKGDIAKIDDLIVEAETEAQKNDGKKDKGNTSEKPKEEKSSPIITSGFTEYTPIDKIRNESSGGGPKIIT